MWAYQYVFTGGFFKVEQSTVQLLLGGSPDFPKLKRLAQLNSTSCSPLLKKFVEYYNAFIRILEGKMTYEQLSEIVRMQMLCNAWSNLREKPIFFNAAISDSFLT